MALRPGLTAVMRRRCASTTSAQEKSFRAIPPASSRADRVQSSAMGFVRVTAGPLRMAQHAQTEAATRPRGRATRPTRRLVFVCKLRGEAIVQVRIVQKSDGLLAEQRGFVESAIPVLGCEIALTDAH